MCYKFSPEASFLLCLFKFIFDYIFFFFLQRMPMKLNQITKGEKLFSVAFAF